MCEKNGYKITESAQEKVNKTLNELHHARSDNFANARTVRNLFEKLLTIQADRLAKLDTVSDEELCLIIEEDIDNIDLDDLMR